MPARLADEELGRRHGLIGQETTGVGDGKGIAHHPGHPGRGCCHAETCPGARLINFTNLPVW